ncbi:MAG: hypothetical protein LBT66_09270 [Methanobrevibacter sp.]|jgi:chromate transport protein ChrA|nr:hypothetical protein [Candidatus Methanovirga meridionalis]
MVNAESNNDQTTVILRVLGLVGGISAFTQVFGYLLMMIQASGTEGLSQIFLNPVIVAVLILSILAIVASTFYFKNEKIMSVILIIAGIGSIIAMSSPEFSAVLIFVAGFIGLFRFIKSRKAEKLYGVEESVEEDF